MSKSRTERPIHDPIDPGCRLDLPFYERLRAAKDSYTLLEDFVIAPFSGRGFIVEKGCAFRVVLEDGPQVGDVAFWNRDDRYEYFSATRTSLLEGWFLRPYCRLWSDVPRLRPMATCLDDTVATTDPEYHHHSVGTHCATEWIELRGGGPGHNSCRLNLLQAIQPFGLGETDIRDNINIHQKLRLDAGGHVYAAPSEGQKGDYIELYAEIDLLVALSICPNADNTRYWSTPEDGIVKPLRVQIYDTQVMPQEFREWTDWRQSWSGEWEPSMLEEG